MKNDEGRGSVMVNIRVFNFFLLFEGRGGKGQ